MNNLEELGQENKQLTHELEELEQQVQIHLVLKSVLEKAKANLLRRDKYEEIY